MLKKRKPKILLLIDKPNWAFDICASEYIKFLSNDFTFVKKFLVKPRPIIFPFRYDLIHIFWWGESWYKRFRWPKAKILKEVSSHRWEDDPRYGPCTPEEFTKKYLFDARNVLCTSKKLYSLLEKHIPNLSLASNGYSPEIFYFKNERTASLPNLCWVGNRNDAVKGIDDILIPAAKEAGLEINIATNLPHKELCDFYNTHDIYLVGSTHEASPLTLMEAMACGCFPICTDVGIVSELIQHLINGYIVKDRSIKAFSEAFEWCKKNLDFVRVAGKQNAKLLKETRTWEHCAESYRTAYKKALSK